MSERREQFETVERPEVDVRFPSGRLTVVEGEPGRVMVRVDGPDASAFEVAERRGRVVVRLDGASFRRWRDHAVTVAVPAGTALAGRVASAGVAVTVDLRRLDVHSAAGDVEAGRISGHATIRTASGDVRLRAVEGEVRVSSASGDVEIGLAAASVGLNTAGGDIRLGRAHGAVTIRSASGDVVLDRYAGDDLSCATVSGDVTVGLEAGRLVDLDLYSLAGDVDNEFALDDASAEEAGDGQADSGAVGRLRVRSTAGDVRVRRAVAV